MRRRRIDGRRDRFRSIQLALACAGGLAAGAVGLSGCNSSGAGSPMSMPDSGADAAASADQAGAACPPRPDLVQASPACNTLVSSAGAVPFTAATGTPPVPSGGAITDGLYEATRAQGWGAVTPSGRRLTIAVLQGATRILWTGDVLDPTGTTVTTSFRADSSGTVTGDQIDLTTDCFSTATSPIPVSVGFTATPDQLLFIAGSGANVAATTYTRRGCAP